MSLVALGTFVTGATLTLGRAWAGSLLSGLTSRRLGAEGNTRTLTDGHVLAARSFHGSLRRDRVGVDLLLAAYHY